MQIRYHEETFVFFLHKDIIPDGSKIIAEVQEPGWPDATHYYRFLFLHEAAKIRKVGSRSS
jgi:hypothetical protein